MAFHAFWDTLPIQVAEFPSNIDPHYLSSYIKSLSSNSKFLLKEIEAEIALVLSSNYIDDLGVLNYFKEYIKNAKKNSKFFSVDVSEQKYLAPVVPLCQRSGSGKTRLLLEAGRQHFPLVYISFGEVLQSPDNITLFLKSLASLSSSRPDNENKALVFFATLVSFVLEKFQIWSRRTKLKTANSAFYSELVTLFQPVGVPEKKHDLQILWATILKEVDSNLANPQFSAKNLFAQYEKSGLPKLLVAIDEAKELLNDDPSKDTISAFRIIRTSLSGLIGSLDTEIPDGVITVIVADTYSSITNFAPVSKPNFSGRDVKSVGILIPPFFLLSGHDVMAKIYLSGCKSIQKQHENANWYQFLNSRDQSAFEFVRLGSPLWGAFIVYKHLTDTEKDIGLLIAFAAFKLQGSGLITLSIHYIAALTARASLTIVARSSLANELVAGCMAQLDMISSKRDCVFVSYPSDVTLAQGAASLIRGNPKEALQSLHDHLSTSQISIGDGGESVAELLLLAAIDYSGMRFKSILVKEFLENLFGISVAKPLLETFSKKPILKGRLFFNHFVKLQNSAVAANIPYFFTRGAGISGYPVQFGWDLCIPVCLEDGRLTAIFVQVKNYKDMLADSYIIGLMQKMRLAGLQLFNPTAYAELWDSAKEKKPNNVELGKRIREIGANAQNLEDLSLNICINFLQGEPVRPDAVSENIKRLPSAFKLIACPHISQVQASHNFICLQGMSTDAFPNFWGSTVEEKENCFSLLRRLLVPRSDYSRQLSHDYNSEFVDTFNRFDHGHAICEFKN